MIVALATHAMGTRFEIILEGANETHLRAVGEEVIHDINSWHQRLNRFARDSDVSRINRLASHEPVEIDPELFELLQSCARLTEQTQGAFDITIGHLMRAYGLHDGQSPTPPRRHGGASRSAGSQIHDRIDQPYGTHRIQLDESTHIIRFAQDGIEIDLGGIAKGFVLDRAAEIVRAHNIERAFIHGGTSTAIAIGAPSDQPGFNIAIRPPHDSDESDDDIDMPRESWTVPLRDGALSVSALHGRTAQDENGETIGHVIDPRSGRPVSDTLLAAVVSDSAPEADAWSTALLVLGEHPPDAPDSLSSLILHRTDEGGWEWLADGACPTIFRRTLLTAGNPAG